MTVVLTLADIAEHRPPFGSIIRIAPCKLVVFARRPGSIGCEDCAFADDHPECRVVNCFGGAYVPKDKYLEMRLLGEL